MNSAGSAIARLFAYALLIAVALTGAGIGVFMLFVSALAIGPEDEVSTSSYLVPFAVSAAALLLTISIWALGVLRRWRDVPGPIGWNADWNA